MGMMECMNSLLPDEITIEPFASESSARVKSYGDAVTYRAQVETWIERVITREGNEVTSAAKATIPGRVAIDTRSRLTLPTGWTPNQPPIIAVRPKGGVLNLDHTEILM